MSGINRLKAAVLLLVCAVSPRAFAQHGQTHEHRAGERQEASGGRR
jgi:hypothetical protein